MSEETTKRDNKIKTIGVILVVVLCLSIYPAYWVSKGYQFAQEAATHGIEVSVATKVDGFGYGARMSDAAFNRTVAFDNAYYEKIIAGGYLQNRFGVAEGLSGFFFGVGTKLGN